MAKINKEEFVASLKEMTILEINELVKAIETEFGVSAAAMAVATTGAVAVEEESEGPSEVSVILVEVGASKLNVVKALRDITGLPLGDAKKLADVVPSVVKEHISPVAADEVKAKLEEAGAKVEIK